MLIVLRTFSALFYSQIFSLLFIFWFCNLLKTNEKSLKLTIVNNLYQHFNTPLL